MILKNPCQLVALVLETGPPPIDADCEEINNRLPFPLMNLLPDPMQKSLLLTLIKSELRDSSPSQILGTFSRFSENFPGSERPLREDPLGSVRIPYGPPPLSLCQ